MSLRSLGRIFPLLLLLLLLTDPAGAVDSSTDLLQREAQTLIQGKDYVGAAAKLEVAIAKNPDQAGPYLQLCDVLEALGQDAEAQKTLQQGLKAVAAQDPQQIQMKYRSGLLAALKLADRKTAEAMAQSLPTGSQKSDLQGVLALLDKQSKSALDQFVEALPKAGDPDAEARIHYHAALAHHGAADLDNAAASLFNAINKASNLALIKDIEKLWAQLHALQLKSRGQ
jgi:tetratricopeptide (TPR) repeat protein